MLPADIQKRPPVPRCKDQLRKSCGIARAVLGIESGGARCRRGPRPHTEDRQVAPPVQAGKAGDPGFGCEDQTRDTLQLDLRRQQVKPAQRRYDNGPVRAETGTEFGCEPFGLPRRPRQKQRGQVGCVGHLPTPGIVWPCHGCYLPGNPCATEADMSAPITVLGLESSCDDTAAAVVRLSDGKAHILSSVVFGQTALHEDFGGVVPEIAARAHAEKIDLCAAEALAKAQVGLTDLTAIAVTAGPGLIGGVLAGVMCAKGLSAATGLPLVGVNHLAGHALTPRLTDGLAFPYLMLLVSGGHCQFLIAEAPDRFTRLGGTIDDAPGEAFDKTARLLGLPQPGGPSVETEAVGGDAGRFAFPRPLLDRPGCDLSFSGLKTALLRARDSIVAQKGGLTRQDRADLCAGFQAAVADVLAEKSRRAIGEYLAVSPAVPAFAVAGGVAANSAIRARLEAVALGAGVRFVAPPLSLCTDNAAMIAWAGIERFRLGLTDDLTLVARPRWPLDDRAPGLLGSGKKGAKA